MFVCRRLFIIYLSIYLSIYIYIYIYMYIYIYIYIYKFFIRLKEKNSILCFHYKFFSGLKNYPHQM